MNPYRPNVRYTSEEFWKRDVEREEARALRDIERRLEEDAARSLLHIDAIVYGCFAFVIWLVVSWWLA